MNRKRAVLIGLVALVGLAIVLSVRARNSGCSLPPPPPESSAVSRVKLGIEVLTVAAGPKGLWAIYRPDTTTRILLVELDPATSKLKDRPIELPSRARSLAVGKDAIWVMTTERTARPSGVLNRIDPKTHRIVATLRVGSGSSAVAADEKAVWIGNGKPKTVVQIDPAGPRIVRTVRLEESPQQLFAQSGALWVRTEAGDIYRIDSRTGRTNVLAEIGALGNVGAGGVWVIGNGPPNGQLRRLDPMTLRLTGPSLGLDIAPSSVGIAGNQLWLGKWYKFCPPNTPRNYRGLLPLSRGWSRLDPRTLKALSGPVYIGESLSTPVYASGTFWMLPLTVGNEIIRIDLAAAAKVRP